ncbi:MAG: hypothetical protein KIT58_12045 [Planctomycetota bacterium]|nr:hypothetical protein [Planctomycetota bacterium]
MDETECIRRFGLNPRAADLAEIRGLLARQSDAERREQGEGDTALMRLLSVQLFNAGLVEDALLIWRAKTSSFDADASIDLQLLLGAGLDETLAHLAKATTPEAAAALARLNAAQARGSLASFTVNGAKADHEAHYLGDPEA